MPMNIREETLFWTRQFSEHLGFLHTMLQGELRDEALVRQAEYDALREATQGLDGGAMAAALEDSTRDLFTFQISLCNRLNAGEWLGYAWPLFCDHITREVQLYLHLAYGDRAPSGGVEAAVSQMGGEHALLAANLIDPGSPDPSKAARDAGSKLLRMSKNEQTRSNMLGEIELQKAITQFIHKTGLGTPQGVKSLVPLTLRDHVLREQDYYARKLQDAVSSNRIMKNKKTRYSETRRMLGL